MLKLTLHGGVNEIGGNKFLLETRKARIWLDFGLSFARLSKFYSEFMRPRKYNGLKDFFVMGLLPEYKGLYRSDFIKKTGKDIEELAFDGVFVSHAHVDHTGFIPLLHKELPIYCGATTSLILRAMQDTSQGFEHEFYLMKEHFTGLHHTHVPRFVRNLQIFRTGKKIDVEDVEVEPIHVDHSVPGAYGMIIRTPSKSIVYTGDIRDHGRRPELTEDFLKAAESEEPEVLISEGTRLNGEETMSEEEVLEAIKKTIFSTKGIVLANWPARDTDRLNTFYEAAKESGRKLVIPTKMAYLLKLLEQDEYLKVPRINDENILIYAKRAGDGLITESGSPRHKVERDYDMWERELLWLPNTVTWKEVKEMQKEVVMYLDSWSFGELIDIKPLKGSCYIRSMTMPFCDEMELDYKRMENWLKHFGIALHQAHASGHMSQEGLLEMARRINPKLLIPVHTEKEWIPHWKQAVKNVIEPCQGMSLNLEQL